MTPIRLLFRLYVRTLEFLTLHQKPERTCNLSCEPVEGKSVDIITVAFNNAELIQYQTGFVDKFIKDSFVRIIIDNSTDKDCREALYQYCLSNGIAYLGMPKNFLNRVGGSYSHAAALNYTYRHIIEKRKPFAFGQIDHDLFPTRPISIIEKLQNQPIYGPLRKRGDCWYLSAIMSFFRYDFTRGKKVDFMPVKPHGEYLDSGGGNWYGLYSTLSEDKIVFPTECVESLREGGDRHGDSLEFFDDKLWLHTINGSCWKKIGDQEGKDALVKAYLENKLN